MDEFNGGSRYLQGLLITHKLLRLKIGNFKAQSDYPIGRNVDY